MKGKGNGEVEGVVGGLVDDDLLVSTRAREGKGSARAWEESREATHFASENLLRST